MLRQSITSIHQQFIQDISLVVSTSELEALKVKYLGKKGPINSLMKELKEAPIEERPTLGKCINDLKEEISEQISTKEHVLVAQEEAIQLKQEMLDVTLPGRNHFPGRKHVLTQTMDEIIDIWSAMGFTVQYGPDIDNDYYNFEALNFAADHPARDMQDTYYITPNILLRTHTSNVQVRIMENHKPPIRIIAPGKAYRNEAITARSHVFFHQVEVVYINENVSFADLLSTIQEFLYKLFSKEVNVRYRPSYFPFTEPSMEVDISCLSCNGTGCFLCKYMQWLEVLGAGMIHPDVLAAGGIDSNVYTGYALGIGVERLAMLKYGINDIRLFTENDMRFLSQFPGV